MATKQTKTPPAVHPKFDVEQAPQQPPQGVTGIGDRGTESGVPFVLDGAGRKFVGAGHPKAGEPW